MTLNINIPTFEILQIKILRTLTETSFCATYEGFTDKKFTNAETICKDDLHRGKAKHL